MRSIAGSDLGRRLKVAIPVFAAVVGIDIAGQWLLALVLVVFSWICMDEFSKMAGLARLSVVPTSYLVLAGIMAVAVSGTLSDVLLLLGLAVVLLFPATLLDRQDLGSGIGIRVMATALFGIFWIGVPFACAVQLRGLPHGGALVLDVVVAVSVSDSAAYLVGRLLGRHKLAPLISPNKTVEGWVIGLLAAVAALYVAHLLEGWLTLAQALVFGFGVALVASVGDLFESYVKRDVGTKDTSELFGAHGGALDRVDAMLFGAVTGYVLAQLFGL
ncbi:MAG TPA: phosphatidate cytidylyltransferase [Candidatus Saccharimonadales bacterium]|jgi:phosphatidate cytidylyltransferase|nr:phosphatidate cytidylyltransferase [Candidatus Saccharimonadales bacterium]